MSEVISRAKLQIIAWRIAIAWFALFSINALCSSIMAALIGKDWSSLHGQDKFLIFIAVTTNWTSTIMAFFSKAARRMESDQPLIPTDPVGNTEFIPKPPAPTPPQ